MTEKTKETTQVKVDNWGIFLQQRMHHFFIKNEHWDLTLLFSTSDKLKVHRLVLFACTDYFQSMSMQNHEEDGDYLQLDSEMDPQVVIPIIHFMYTGRLEFPVQLYEKLYNTALKLKMKILAKLIDGHRAAISKSSTPQPKKFGQESVGKTTSMLQISSFPENGQQKLMKKVVNKPVVTISTLNNSATNDKSLKPVGSPQHLIIKHLPHNQTEVPSEQVTRNLTFESTINRKDVKITKQFVTSNWGTKNLMNSPLPSPLPGRKLPIWKRILPDSPQPKQPVEAKPTRFEWDEDLDDISEIQPVEDALNILSHDKDVQVLQPIALNDDGTRVTTTAADVNNGLDSSSPPKRIKLEDLNAMKEHCKQQLLRSEMVKDNEDDEDDEDYADDFEEDTGDQDTKGDLSPHQGTTSNINAKSTPKPILKTVTKETPQAKRVRFSLEGKENDDQSSDKTSEDGDSVSVVRTVKKSISPPMYEPRTPVLEPGQLLPPGNAHAKIVTEVLKKYPNLVRHSRNIKLKILSKPGTGLPSTVQPAGVKLDVEPGDQKVQYVLVKNNPQPLSGTDSVKIFDPENTDGPWLCKPCCNDQGEPMEFDSYKSYRKHLVEVHELKIDARICEHCGIKSSKRNHLLHHLYTRHNIEPPGHIEFPKCKSCDHIALSQTMLQRHMASHDVNMELNCKICDVFFRSYNSLLCHLNSDFHKCNAAKTEMSYRCPYCENSFQLKDDLRKHILSNHWSENKSEEELNESELQPEEQDLKGSEIIQQQPSSELEALSNVASGITTSLTLVGNEQNVVYYDQNYVQSQDIGGEATISSGCDVQEYVVQDETYINTETKEYEDETEVEQEEAVDDECGHVRTYEDSGTTYSDHDYTEHGESMQHQHQHHQQQQQEEEQEQVQEEEQQQPQQLHQQILNNKIVLQQPGLLFQQSGGVVMAPGNMVLSADGQILAAPNMVLQQVIPQSRFILSNQLLTHNIDPNSGIIFTNSEVPQYYSDGTRVIMTTQNVIQEELEEREEEEEEETEQTVEMMEEEVQQDDTEVVVEEEVMEVEEQDTVEEEQEEVEEEQEEVEKEEEEVVENDVEQVVPESGAVIVRTDKRIDTSKLVDDWDENNSDVNIEERTEGGPSRAFF